MVERRSMLGRGLFAGLTGLFVAPAVASAGTSAGDDTSQAAADAINKMRQFFEQQADPTELGPSKTIDAIRQAQRSYLQANRKYPDFIEVGIAVWEDVYDWHVKHQQPITANRLADGRYTIAFMFTSLILRPDQDQNHVGFPFDAEPARRG